MAITILTEPQEIQPAYNEVMVVLDSTNKAEPKFQYVVDVNVEAVNVSRLKIQSNPQGYGVLNLSKHLEPYIGSNINMDSSDIKPFVNRNDLVFDSKTLDIVNLGATPEISGSAELTLDMNINLTSDTGGGAVVYKSGVFLVFYDNATDNLLVNLVVASGTATVNTTVLPDVFTDVNITYLNDVLTLKIDGVIVDTDNTQSGVINAGVSDMYIGGYTPYNSTLMNISTFKLYNESLTSHLNIFKDIVDTHAEYDITLSEEYVLTSSFTSVADVGGFTQYTYAAAHNYSVGDFVTVSSSTVPAYDGVQEVTALTSTTITTTRTYSATATGDSVLSNGTTTIISDAAVFTGNKHALNNVLNWRNVPNWNAPDYNLGLVDRGKFLTNVPATMITRLDDRFTFNFFNNGLSPAKTFLKVVTSDARTYYFENNGSTTQTFLSVSVGAYDMANSDTELYSGFVSDAAPVITSDTDSYTVELVDENGDTKTEVRTFEIDRTCTNYDNYKLIYLNKAGSFTTFNFELAHSKNVSARKKNYQQNYGSYNATTNSYGWTDSDRGTRRLDTDITETYTINSNYVKEAYGNLIEDLIISPEVYHLDNGVLRSIDVLTDSVKIKQRRVEKLINYSLSFTYSNKNTVQR